MHFPIIEIIDPNDKYSYPCDGNMFDDPLFQLECDYYGEEYPDADRKRAIKTTVKDLFVGIADVDDEGNIKFYDKETIEKTLRSEYSEVVESINSNYEENKLSAWKLRNYGKYFRDNDSLIWYNIGRTTWQFMEDAAFYADKTFKVGKIFDAHC